MGGGTGLGGRGGDSKGRLGLQHACGKVRDRGRRDRDHARGLANRRKSKGRAFGADTIIIWSRLLAVSEIRPGSWARA